MRYTFLKVSQGSQPCQNDLQDLGHAQQLSALQSLKHVRHDTDVLCSRMSHVTTVPGSRYTRSEFKE